MYDKDKELSDSERKIIRAIDKIQSLQYGTVSKSPFWIKTREIAEECDVDIYQARYLLLKLERKGFVIHLDSDKKVPLRWRSTNNNR